MFIITEYLEGNLTGLQKVQRDWLCCSLATPPFTRSLFIRGTYGVVYRGTKKEDGTEVAVKIISRRDLGEKKVMSTFMKPQHRLFLFMLHYLWLV